jgi:FkbM family methyltransferase
MSLDLLARALRLLPPGLIRRIGRAQWAGQLQHRVVAAGSGWLRRREIIVPHGAAAGLRFNAGGANPGYALGTSEPLVQDALLRHVRLGDVVLDVGANVGFHTVIAARIVGPAGHVYAIEPFPQNVAALAHNLALNAFTQVTIIAAAAWREEGRADLVVSGEPTWARLNAVRAREGTERSVPVRLVAVDDLVRHGVVRPPAVVKVDVEGAEIEALQGMAHTLAAWRPTVICEMHGRNAEYVALMRAHGYVLTVLQEPAPLERARWDVHLVAVHPAGPAARR